MSNLAYGYEAEKTVRVELRLTGGPTQIVTAERVSIGFLRGALAVHPRPAEAAHARNCHQQWVITHIPTGSVFARGVDRADAIRHAQETVRARGRRRIEAAFRRMRTAVIAASWPKARIA